MNLHLQTTVTDLDTQNKTVTIKKMATLQKSLTIIILKPRVASNELPINGINEYNNVLFMRGEDWAGKIKERMQHAKKAIVVGGGYIGIEGRSLYQSRHRYNTYG